MKVAMFNGASLLNYGGGEQGFILWANQLRKMGVSVTIFDYGYVQTKRITPERLRELVNVSVVRYRGFHFFGVEQIPLTKSYLLALLATSNFDVIYTSNSALTHTIPMRLATWLFRKRVIFEISDPSFDPVALSHASRLERLIKSARKVVAATYPNIRVLNRADQRRYRQKNNHVYLLAPPTREFHPKITKANQFDVLFVARSDLVQKGIDLLPEVITRTLESSKSIRFVIVGSGGRGEQTLRRLAAQFPANVAWKGFVPTAELDSIFPSSQLFILTSRYETFGASVLEAQRNGLPVVAFDIPGPSDIITSSSQGVLVPGFDVPTFVSSILDYYDKWRSNPDAYVELRANIIEEAAAKFNNEELLRGFYGLLRGDF